MSTPGQAMIVTSFMLLPMYPYISLRTQQPAHVLRAIILLPVQR